MRILRHSAADRSGEPAAVTKAARSVIFQELVSVIGRESARKLVETMGGLDLFVPEKIGPTHPLAKALGLDTARQLSAVFRRTRITIPVSRARRRRVRELAGTMTRQQIALKTGYSERHVYRLLGEDGDTGQGDLFPSGREA